MIILIILSHYYRCRTGWFKLFYSDQRMNCGQNKWIKVKKIRVNRLIIIWILKKWTTRKQQRDYLLFVQEFEKMVFRCYWGFDDRFRRHLCCFTSHLSIRLLSIVKAGCLIGDGKKSAPVTMSRETRRVSRGKYW